MINAKHSLSWRSKILSLILSLILCGLAYLYFQEIQGSRLSLVYSDYGKFYASARFARYGFDLYSPIFVVSKYFASSTPLLLSANLNPPFFELLVFPLSYFSYSTSLFIWLLLLAGCGIYSLGLLIKLLDLHPPSFNIWLIGLILFFGYYPTFISVQFAQLSLLLLPLLIGSWRLARGEQVVYAAFLLGIAASIKLFFGLFVLYFLIRREWWALLIFCITGLLCSSLPLLLFSIHDYYSYYQGISHIWWYSSSWNTSLFGFILRLFGNYLELNTPFWPHPSLTHPIYGLSTALILISFIKLLWPNTRLNKAQRCDLDFALTLTTLLLITPLSWVYYFPWLFIPFLILYQLAESGYYPVGLPIITSIILIFSSLPYPLLKPVLIKGSIIIFAHAGFYCYALVLLWGTLAFMRVKLAQGTPPMQTPQLPKRIVLLLYSIAFLPSLIGLIPIAPQITFHLNAYLPPGEMLPPTPLIALKQN